MRALPGCDECRDLQSHEFRDSADLLNALQVAAAEVDRGVLRRLDTKDLNASEQEAMDSVFTSEALPGAVRYRFQCSVCGARFELNADIDEGSGNWARAKD